MKKIILIIVFAFLFCSCSQKLQTNDMNQMIDIKEEGILLAELPEENIYLYSKAKEEDMYTGLILKIKDNIKEYNWENVSNPGFYPNLILNDINGDGKKELIIILTVGTGTGVHKEKIHVLDSESLEEQTVDNPVQIANSKIDSKIQSENSLTNITVLVNDEEIIINKNINDAGAWFDKIGYGNIIKFYIENDKLKVNIPAQASPSMFIADVIIEYTYQEGVYVFDKIAFNKHLEN